MAIPRNVIGAILWTAAMATGVSGSAQEPEASATSEIIVEAPRSVPLPAERSPFTGAPIVVSTVRIPVFYDDLDLAQTRDQGRLITRVQRVAHDVCRELDRIHPFNPDADCVSKAVASGSAAAKSAIDAATARAQP